MKNLEDQENLAGKIALLRLDLNVPLKNKDILDIIAYCDGKKSVDEISEILKISIIKIKIVFVC